MTRPGRGDEQLCSAMVSSTTPRPAPIWPPVTEHDSIRKARTSSAKTRISSLERARMSAGEWMVEEAHLSWRRQGFIHPSCRYSPATANKRRQKSEPSVRNERAGLTTSLPISAPSGNRSLSGSCRILVGVSGDVVSLPFPYQERRVWTTEPAASSCGDWIPASLSAEHACSHNLSARARASASPIKAGYVLFLSAASRPAVC